MSSPLGLAGRVEHELLGHEGVHLEFAGLVEVALKEFSHLLLARAVLGGHGVLAQKPSKCIRDGNHQIASIQVKLLDHFLVDVRPHKRDIRRRLGQVIESQLVQVLDSFRIERCFLLQVRAHLVSTHFEALVDGLLRPATCWPGLDRDESETDH